MLQRDFRRGRIEQKCAPKPPPIRPRKPLQTNGGTDELAPPACGRILSQLLTGRGSDLAPMSRGGLSEDPPPHGRSDRFRRHSSSAAGIPAIRRLSSSVKLIPWCNSSNCAAARWYASSAPRSEEHTSELQSLRHLV